MTTPKAPTVTISELHKFIDRYAPDGAERRTLHFALERLFMFEVGQIPELRATADAELRRLFEQP